MTWVAKLKGRWLMRASDDVRTTRVELERKVACSKVTQRVHMLNRKRAVHVYEGLYLIKVYD